MDRIEQVCRAICDSEGIHPDRWQEKRRTGEAVISVMRDVLNGTHDGKPASLNGRVAASCNNLPSG
jgi:hypothetical protein